MRPLLLAALVAFSSVAHAGEVRRFALIIGSNDGGAERVRLRYANTDAHSMADVLTDVGGVAPQDLVLLEEPGAEAISDAFETLSARIIAARAGASRVEVVVYYSGHADEAGMLPGGQPYAWSRLRTELARLDVDVRVAILDACASGALVLGKGGAFRPPFLQDDTTTVEGSAFLTSSTADEASQESDRIGGSYFTHHLVAALRGAADTDTDGTVTLSETYAYTFRETRRSTETSRLGTQTPTYALDLAGGGDVVLTDLRAGSAQLVIDASVGGELWVRASDGQWLAQLDKAPGRELTLSVPPGTWRVTLQSRPVAYTADVVVRPDGVTTLKPSDLHAATLDGVQRARGGAERVVHADFQVVGKPNGKLARRDVVGGAFHLFGGVQHALTGFTMSTFGTRVLDRMDGAQLALAYTDVDGDARGVQAAAGATLVGGHLDGLQLSAFATVIGGRSPESSYATQLAGLVAVSGGPLKGGQAASLVTVARGHLTGAQLAGLVAHTQGGVDGAQFATLASIARGTVRGAQWSGLYNDAVGLHGAQLGIFNRTDHGTGAQIGVVNVARELHGVQFGVFNIADKLDGEAIGLVTIARNGYHDWELWTDDLTPVATGFKFGSKHLYTLLLAGLDPFERTRVSVGAGFGVHAGFFDDRMFLDTDLIARTSELDVTRARPQLDAAIVSARVTVGGTVAGPLGLFVGPAFHLVTPVADDTPRRQSLLPPVFRIEGGLRGHVGYQAGLRLKF